MTTRDNPNKEYGEGNYKASRQYNEATKAFVEAGQVDAAAKKAAPRTREEADALRRAEEAGRKRAKEEDPALGDAAPRRTKADEDAIDAGTPAPKPGHDAQ